MDLANVVKLIDESKDLSSKEIELYWNRCLEGDIEANKYLKYYYMKLLSRVKSLYTNYNENVFYSVIEQSVDKSLERALKFKVENFDTYMSFASQTYFKYNISPDNISNSLNIPLQLIKAFSKIEEVYKLIPTLTNIDEQSQINLISTGFEYPIFSTRLLYYSFKKWKNNTLRQVDIDLCVALLPTPLRIEWEIFYEKDVLDIKETILKQMDYIL